MYKSQRIKWNNPPKNENGSNEPKSIIVKYFELFAVELEEKQDRYERILKISRDITIESKRLIFFLHTYRRGTPEGEKVLNDAKSRLINLVKNQFSCILKELHERDIYQFLRSYSFGVQEFIEAFSFYYYLLTESLLTYEKVKIFLLTHYKPSGPIITDLPVEPEQKCAGVVQKNEFLEKNCFITMTDYVLGLNDLTGELMRYCINQISCSETQTAFDVCRFLANLYTGMLSVGFNNRDFSRKMITVLQSVKKVEIACYTVRVRGSEIPKHMILNVIENEDNHGEETHF